MSSILSSPIHCFSVNIAIKLGVMEAIVLHHITLWIDFNRRMKKNFIEGTTWSYQTMEEIAASLPYFSVDQIFRAIKRLVQSKILKTANHNKTSYDRTLWYAFADDAFIENSSIPQNCGMEDAKLKNPDRKIAEPIPCIKNIEENKQQQPTKSAPVAAGVFECLRKLDIPKADKERLSSKYSEEDIKHAVAYATHPDTEIKTCLAKVLYWAAKEKPDLPVDVVALSKENKPYAIAMEAKVPPKSHSQISALHDRVEVYTTASCFKQPSIIEYAHPNFRETFHKALEAFQLEYLIKEESYVK